MTVTMILTSRQIIKASCAKTSQVPGTSKFLPNHTNTRNMLYFNRSIHWGNLNIATKAATSSFSTFINNNSNMNTHLNNTDTNTMRRNNFRQPQLVNKFSSMSTPTSSLFPSSQFKKSLLPTKTTSLYHNNFCALADYLHYHNHHHHHHSYKIYTQLNAKKHINSNTNSADRLKVDQMVTQLQGDADSTVSTTITKDYDKTIQSSTDPMDRRTLF